MHESCICRSQCQSIVDHINGRRMITNKKRQNNKSIDSPRHIVQRKNCFYVTFAQLLRLALISSILLLVLLLLLCEGNENHLVTFADSSQSTAFACESSFGCRTLHAFQAKIYTHTIHSSILYTLYN